MRRVRPGSFQRGGSVKVAVSLRGDLIAAGIVTPVPEPLRRGQQPCRVRPQVFDLAHATTPLPELGVANVGQQNDSRVTSLWY